MKPVPFMHSALELAELCQEIESEEGELSAALIARFKQAEAHLAWSIDRRKAFMVEVKARKQMGKDRIAQIQKVIKTLENIEDELKAITAHAIRNAPGIKFRDSLGQGVTLRKTKPCLKITAGSPLSLTHTLPGYLEGFTQEVAPQYVVPVITYVIDKVAVREDLEAGAILPWARLEQGEAVWGL